MSGIVRDALRSAAELAVRTGQGGDFVVTARQELAAAVVEVSEAVAVNADVAASASGLSPRSLRRHLAERREALREEAADSVDGEPNEQAMLHLRALAREHGGRVSSRQVLSTARRFFPGPPKRHRFMRDVWLDHGWLVPHVSGGFRVSSVTSAYRPGPDRAVMADVRRQALSLLSGSPVDERPLADRRLRLPLRIDPSAGGLPLADDLRRAVINRLSAYEHAHGRGASTRPGRTLKLALVAAFDAPPTDEAALVIWAEARVTMPGTRELLSVLTTDPIDPADAARAVTELTDDLTVVTHAHAPPDNLPAIQGSLLVVTCFV